MSHHDEPPIIIEDGRSVHFHCRGLEHGERNCCQSNRQANALSVFFLTPKGPKPGKNFTGVTNLNLKIETEGKKALKTIKIRTEPHVHFDTPLQFADEPELDGTQRNVRSLPGKVRIKSYEVKHSGGTYVADVNTKSVQKTMFFMTELKESPATVKSAEGG